MTPTLPDPHHPTSEELFAYRDGELPGERRALVEAHVLACAQCRDRIDEMSAAEAMLRQRPDRADAAYFDRMTESVMARIGVLGREGREVAGAGRHVTAEGEAIPPGVRGGGYIDVPRVERRRPDTVSDDLGRRRRLHLPWIGITGSAAAAVAVLVAVVLLFQRQNEWIRAPRPGVLGEPRAGAPAESSVASGSSATQVSERPPALAKRSDRLAKQEELKSRAAAPPAQPAPGVAGLRTPAAELRDEGAKKDQSADFRENAASPTPSVAEREEATEAQKLAVARELARVQNKTMNAAPNALQGGPEAARDYANVIRAHGLPALWNQGVSSQAVARAETDLRFLYQTGRAGADSARIRLYLAEAERARLTDPTNTAAVESISHHYRRAISLAGGDAALAATARQRLDEFEEQMIRARGTTP